MLPDSAPSPKLRTGTVLDGYRLFHPIGRGGFGEVWLCRLEATEEFKALKFIPSLDPEKLERELEAVKRYRLLASNLHSPHLLFIEHVNRTQDGLFYTMPLADGMESGEPLDAQWKPKTLAALIFQQRNAPVWFSAKEICEVMQPLIQVVGQLNDAGVVHRDIKPENILFINGSPCLGDVGLLTNDSATLSRRGTPGYSAPSWYIETGGKPDMWGLATTLYTLLTGNVPDKIGRAIYLYPPQGKESVGEATWDRFHHIILRAMKGEANERFLQFSDFEKAFVDPQSASAPTSTKAKNKPVIVGILTLLVLTVLAGGCLLGWRLYVAQSSTSKGEPVAPIASTTPIIPTGLVVPKELSRKAAKESQKNTEAIAANDAKLSRMLGGQWELFTAPMEGVSTTYNANGTYKSTIYAKDSTNVETGWWHIENGMLAQWTLSDSTLWYDIIKITRLDSETFEGQEMEGRKKGEAVRLLHHEDLGRGD